VDYDSPGDSIVSECGGVSDFGSKGTECIFGLVIGWVQGGTVVFGRQ